MNDRKSYLLIAAVLAVVASCAPNYRDISTPNGQQAILDQADDFLTAGDCDQALNVLAPLIHSAYSSYTAQIKYASAYACKAGVNFPTLIGNLNNTGSSSVWSILVKTNYSASSADGHLTNLDNAMSVLYQTANPAGQESAAQRTGDANTFAVFLQLNVIASVISPLGNASSSTGKKAKTITGLGSTSDKCHMQVAVATLIDSLTYVNSSGALKTVSTQLSTLCSSLPGGICPTNLDLTTCMNDSTAVLPTQGQAVIDAVDAVWY